jgi:dipeptidase D
MEEKVRKILDYFRQINEIPRCSKKEEHIARWLTQWAEARQLPVIKDAAGNLVISITPSAGYEQAPTVIIQGHMDMVCEKSPDSNHDFSKDPIRHIYDGDWLHADKTTLGADNGIAVAMAMAIADDKNLLHPPLELLITVDEETGLNGAKLLEPGFVQGRILLNLDSETDGVFTVGCAGGRNTHISRELTFSDLAEDNLRFNLTILGLHGGHSGIDIHKQRANANKILARALQHLTASCRVRLVSIKGGTAHNAIPRDACAVFACPPTQAGKIDKIISEFEHIVQTEYEAIDASPTLSLAAVDSGPQAVKALSEQETRAVIDLLLSVPHGVMGMSPVFNGLVETSNNMATVEIKDDSLQILTSQRSSVMSRMDEVTAIINAAAALAGAETSSDSEFAPWTPDMQSPLLKRCKEVYQQLAGRDAGVESIHAGLECAIIGDKYPGMDMISFGPTLKDAHSPNEKLFIPSVGRVWDFLVALLKSYGRK